MVLAGALVPKWVAAAGLTVIAVLVPEMLEVVVSVAVSVWLPAVLRMTVKVPTPLVSVASLGGVIRASVVEK